MWPIHYPDLKTHYLCPMASVNILCKSRAELEAWFKERGEPAFKGRQVYDWLWKRQARDFNEMTNLSKSLREELTAAFALPGLRTDATQVSSDGTIKSRFRLDDDHLIESVLIPVKDKNRFTACVSSQVGCSLTCSFCATGQMKRMRNLRAHEIVDQFIRVNMQSEAHFGHALTNVVYMGMGEPLLNFTEVMESVRILNEEMEFGIKRITISTAGIAKMIDKLTEADVRFNLALSLHAADDSKRNTIMPINESNNLGVLMQALTNFYNQTKNKITFEYIAFDRFNDTLQDARHLAELCRHFPVKINIIEYNPIEGFDGRKSSEDRLEIFASYLQHKGIPVTIRRSRGKDIDAACGQLANKG